MNKVFLAAVGLLTVSACSHREKVLDAEWVSMRHADLPKEASLTRVAPIETKYCMTSWSGSYGLMDEATKQAETKFQVDYIKNASFVLENGNCMEITGEGYRKN